MYSTLYCKQIFFFFCNNRWKQCNNLIEKGWIKRTVRLEKYLNTFRSLFKSMIQFDIYPNNYFVIQIKIEQEKELIHISITPKIWKNSIQTITDPPSNTIMNNIPQYLSIWYLHIENVTKKTFFKNLFYLSFCGFFLSASSAKKYIFLLY